jgi:hypothetical protein
MGIFRYNQIAKKRNSEIAKSILFSVELGFCSVNLCIILFLNLINIA